MKYTLVTLRMNTPSVAGNPFELPGSMDVKELLSLPPEDLVALIVKLAGQSVSDAEDQTATETAVPSAVQPASQPLPAGSPRGMSVEELQRALVEKLKKRPDTNACYLDLRSKTWGKVGAPVLYNPDHPEWPDGGETTTHLATAKKWIMEPQARVAQRIQRLLLGQDLGILVSDAVEAFIAAMHNDPDLGPRHKSVLQRRSYLRNHVKTALGKHRLASLSHSVVQSWIASMESVKWNGDGTSRKEPAQEKSKKAALAALKAMYRFHFPAEDRYPWGRVVTSTRAQRNTQRRLLVASGRAQELFKKRVYEPDEILRLMLCARFLDRRLGGEEYVGVIASWAAPNLAVSMALQLAAASRISELVEIRENNILEEDGFLIVPGTKSHASLRFIPLQHSVRPWITEARAVKRGPTRPTHYLLRTHPEYDAQPNATVYARHMGEVQEIAGLKLTGERSHIFRRTNSSMALVAGIPGAEIKLLLGHSTVLGGATDEYIQVVRQLTTDRHRSYLTLPSPEELDAILDDGWRPPHLRRRTKPTGRPPRKEATEKGNSVNRA